jgi:hypothetical protein
MQRVFLSSINPGMLHSSAASISISYLVYSNFSWVARSFDDLGLKVWRQFQIAFTVSPECNVETEIYLEFNAVMASFSGMAMNQTEVGYLLLYGSLCGPKDCLNPWIQGHFYNC